MAGVWHKEKLSTDEIFAAIRQIIGQDVNTGGLEHMGCAEDDDDIADLTDYDEFNGAVIHQVHNGVTSTAVVESAPVSNGAPSARSATSALTEARTGRGRGDAKGDIDSLPAVPSEFQRTTLPAVIPQHELPLTAAMSVQADTSLASESNSKHYNSQSAADLLPTDPSERQCNSSTVTTEPHEPLSKVTRSNGSDNLASSETGTGDRTQSSVKALSSKSSELQGDTSAAVAVDVIKSTRSIDGSARELLNWLFMAWLDVKLPSLIEPVVRQEIAQLVHKARTGGVTA